MVEVRGVEPRSEKVNLQASTCLVTTLHSPEAEPSNQATTDYPVKFRAMKTGNLITLSYLL